MLLLIFGFYILILDKFNQDTLRQQMQLFFVAFGVRFIMSIAIFHFGLIHVLGDEDASGWKAGYWVAQKWIFYEIGLLQLPSALLETFEHENFGYRYMLGFIFYFLDVPSPLIAAALNCFLGALCIVYIYRISITLFSPKVAERVGWLACFFPSLIIWSAQTVKEPVVIFLETFVIYFTVRMAVFGLSVRHILICSISIVVLYTFRFYAGYFLAVSVAVALMLTQMRKHIMSAVALVVVLAPVTLYFVNIDSIINSRRNQKILDIQYIKYQRNAFSTGQGSNSGVPTHQDMTTSGGFASAVGGGAAHLLLAPFPWQLGGASLRMLLTLPELVVWWGVLGVGLLPGLWRVLRTRFIEMQSILLFSLLMGFLYSLLFGNVGLVFRQRAQLMPWLLIIAMVGVEQLSLRRQSAKQKQQFGRVSTAGYENAVRTATGVKNLPNRVAW